MAQKGDKILTVGAATKSDMSAETHITADMLKEYTAIGRDAFSECSRMESIVIPSNIRRVSNSAFSRCYNLKSVVIEKNGLSELPPLLFYYCNKLEKMVIPESVKKIGYFPFRLSLPNRVQNLVRKTPDGKIIAYKAFGAGMRCRGFKYEEGKTYKLPKWTAPIMCRMGFHACLNPFNVFCYYNGTLGKNLFLHEVYLDGVPNDIICNLNDYHTKVVSSEITIGRELTLQEMVDIFFKLKSEIKTKK